MVKNTNQFHVFFQEEVLTINSVVAIVTWCIGKKWWGNLACSLHLCKVHIERSKPFLAPVASPQPNEYLWYKWPYVPSLNTGMNLQGRPAAVSTAWPPRAKAGSCMKLLETRRTTNTWRCLSLWGIFSWMAVARPRECEDHSRACPAHTMWNQENQP